MKKLKKEDIKKEVFDLYDAFAHNKMQRREFIEKLSLYAVGGVTVASLMSFFIPNDTILATGKDDDLDSGTINYQSDNLKTATTSPNWFMYHGGYNHGGYIGSGSNLTSETVNSKDFGLLRSVDLEGSILSVPAIVDGYIYVGVANSHNEAVVGSNGGTIYKVAITTGETVAQFSWQLTPGEGDSHGFYGMGCTPTIINNKVYFSAFNGHVYCLNQEDLSFVWKTDLRHTDPSKNQPISNTSESIVTNIFANPSLLEKYRNYFAGILAINALDAVICHFDTEYPNVAAQLKKLSKKLDVAVKNDEVKKIKEINDKLTKIVAGRIEAFPKKFETFILKLIPNLGLPVAAGWCSPLVISFENNGQDTSRLYVGVSEGENPLLFGLIYALDANTGKVDWIYCTNQHEANVKNPPNQIPVAAIGGAVTGYNYTTVEGFPQSMGCSVWSAITFDEETGMLYASTGNPQPDGGLPTKGYSNGILALKADTGEFVAFQQMPVETAYRESDVDVDIASSCTLFEFNGQKVVSVTCKNGGFMVCEALKLKIISVTNLLPKKENNEQIQAIDIHPPPSQVNALAPYVSNEVSNKNTGENYYGPFNATAIHPPSGTLFIGVGGPNYHNGGPGIDFNTTPFMRAMYLDTTEPKNVKLKNKWPQDSQDPPHYTKTGASMYTNAGESGLSSPAVVNDVVFCSTSKISLYAFSVADGTLLWSRNIGSQTDGLNGGYGYCLGPAIWKDYVVAGGLILGQSGGILEIYGPLTPDS